MTEFLKPREIVDLPLSNNPYLRALQVANRIGLLGKRIEDIDRTFPLGFIDLMGAIMEIENETGEYIELDDNPGADS